MCAYTMLGVDRNIYETTLIDLLYPLYIVAYGRINYNTATFAYVGGQEYNRLRCIDYDAMLYGELIMHEISL